MMTAKARGKGKIVVFREDSLERPGDATGSGAPSSARSRTSRCSTASRRSSVG